MGTRRWRDRLGARDRRDAGLDGAGREGARRMDPRVVEDRRAVDRLQGGETGPATRRRGGRGDGGGAPYRRGGRAPPPPGRGRGTTRLHRAAARQGAATRPTRPTAPRMDIEGIL